MNNLRKIQKSVEASNIVDACLGENGVWADSTRYRGQCWTRDFVLASLPLLLAQRQFDICNQHLENLTMRQQPNGQIPILFLDTPLTFAVDKIIRTIKTRKMSFMLRRALQGKLWNLTPGTRDSEILYVIGMYEYARESGDKMFIQNNIVPLRKALNFIEVNLVWDGLVVGCDWRDTMEAELGDKPLLTNNSLLYHAYRLNGDLKKAQDLRENILQKLRIDGHYIDYPGSDRFDPLGAALAVLNDVVPSEDYAQMVFDFNEVDSPYGVTIRCKHNPLNGEERQVIERTNGVVVWPFVVGFTVLALLKMGKMEDAERQFEKMLSLEGFREWYDPATGKGYGAEKQLWSAALFLRAL